jgi:hypothetical protein
MPRGPNISSGRPGSTRLRTYRSAYRRCWVGALGSRLESCPGIRRAARITRLCVLAVFGILIVFDVLWTVAEATRGRIGYTIIGVVFLVIECVISFAVYMGMGNVRPVARRRRSLLVLHTRLRPCRTPERSICRSSAPLSPTAETAINDGYPQYSPGRPRCRPCPIMFSHRAATHAPQRRVADIERGRPLWPVVLTAHSGADDVLQCIRVGECVGPA